VYLIVVVERLVCSITFMEGADLSNNVYRLVYLVCPTVNRKGFLVSYSVNIGG